uniref:Uncharacterized protein n=1 Tax=Melopsittacus undulatus TaxID=13146 RepID=A0A8C6JTP8_MELUD
MGKAEVQNLVIVLLQGLHFHTGDSIVDPVPPRPRTWVPGHLSGDAVVAVEEFLPQELVAGHSVPLLADQPHREHVYMVQVEEDLVEDAVREERAAARVHRGILPPRLQTNGPETLPGHSPAPSTPGLPATPRRPRWPRPPPSALPPPHPALPARPPITAPLSAARPERSSAEPPTER